MREIPFEYQLDTGVDEPFVIPEDNVSLRETLFSKAQSFGVEIKTPFKIIITPDVTKFQQGQVETIVKPKHDLLHIPLGFRLRIPPDVAYYHRVLVPFGLDFIVDRTDLSEQTSYKVNLYLKVPEDNSLTIEKDTPVLKIMPIVDTDYNFHYRKKF